MKIGMDLGGSSTRIFFDNGETEYYSVFSQPGNPLINKGVLEFLKERLEGKSASIIACAVSGGGSAEARETLKSELQRFAKKVFVFPDIKAVHYAFFGNGDGIIVISGTGSVVYGKNSGKELQIGGLGYLLGDEGGGFWFGKEFIKRGLLDMQIGKETFFSKSIKNYFRTDNYADILKKIYSFSLPSKLIADFGATVLNSKESFEILDAGAEKLADEVCTAAKMLKTEKPEIGTYGGFFAHSEFFTERFKQYVRKMLGECEYENQKLKVEKAVIKIAEEEIEKRNN